MKTRDARRDDMKRDEGRDGKTARAHHLTGKRQGAGGMMRGLRYPYIELMFVKRVKAG